MVAVAEKLAIDGGVPVRPKRLPAHYPGATLIGEEEKREVLDVLERRSPFRYYGPQPAYKVAELEREFAAMGADAWFSPATQAQLRRLFEKR